VNRFWTRSTNAVSRASLGDHTGDAYSTKGLTFASNLE